MGGTDKALLPLNGRSLIARVIEATRPQVVSLLINSNGPPSRLASFGLPVRADSLPGHLGPLAGLLTGLEWVRDTLPGVCWMASFATDTPYIPADLVARLTEAVRRDQADLAFATSGGRSHPVIGLWPVRLAGPLRHDLTERNVRKMRQWIAGYRVTTVDWPATPVDPFFNINSPEDALALTGTKIPA